MGYLSGRKRDDPIIIASIIITCLIGANYFDDYLWLVVPFFAIMLWLYLRSNYREYKNSLR